MSELHLETRGDGAPLVLLHGWGLNVRVWDALAPLLEAHRRLVTVDLPGHGRSPWRPDRAGASAQLDGVGRAVAARIGSAPYALLGWSLGAQLALRWAAQPPADLRPPAHLVLIAATPRFTAAPDWPHGTPEARLLRMAEGLQSDYQQTVSEFLELQVRGSAAGEAVLERLRAALFTHGEAVPEALTADLALLRTTDLRRGLGGIDTPTLVLAGQYDRVVPPAASRALAAAMPHGSLVEVHRGAHAPFLSHTAEVAALLAQFLTST